MCFRPPDVDVQIFCPNCGKEIMPTGGFVLKKCPFCKEPLPEDGGAAAPSAPQAPGATAPGAPAAPKAPGN